MIWVESSWVSQNMANIMVQHIYTKHTQRRQVLLPNDRPHQTNAINTHQIWTLGSLGDGLTQHYRLGRRRLGSDGVVVRFGAMSVWRCVGRAQHWWHDSHEKVVWLVLMIGSTSTVSIVWVVAGMTSICQTMQCRHYFYAREPIASAFAIPVALNCVSLAVQCCAVCTALPVHSDAIRRRLESMRSSLFYHLTTMTTIMMLFPTNKLLVTWLLQSQILYKGRIY